MPANIPLIASQRVVQICLFLFAAIALSGGALQMYLASRKPPHGSTTCTGSWPASTSVAA